MVRPSGWDGPGVGRQARRRARPERPDSADQRERAGEPTFPRLSPGVLIRRGLLLRNAEDVYAENVVRFFIRAASRAPANRLSILDQRLAVDGY
jgi:hypothetical protein